MTIVSPVEDGLQIQPRLLASQPRIQDILRNMGIIFIGQLFRMYIQKLMTRSKIEKYFVCLDLKI